MAIARYAAKLAEQLSTLIENVPESVQVVQLAPPSTDVVRRRLDAVLDVVEKLSELRKADLKAEIQPARTVLRGIGNTRAVAFHASGAMSVKLGIAEFDQLFEADPGDAKLTDLLQRATKRLGLHNLVPDREKLTFEKLWRLKAAGTDPEGNQSEPVLCRAVGAYRHCLHGLPVYGRASATVELTGKGELASMNVSLRRYAGDGGGKVVAETRVPRPDAAAAEVAARVVKAFGGLEELPGKPCWPRSTWRASPCTEPKSIRRT